MALSSDTNYCARAPTADHDDSTLVDWPELQEIGHATPALFVLRQLLQDARQDETALGTSEWNPLADIVAPGASTYSSISAPIVTSRGSPPSPIDQVALRRGLPPACPRVEVRAQKEE
jgi:hypothetical protein